MSGGGARSAGDLLAELFRRKGMRRSLKRAEAVLLWPRVVGRDVARFSVARGFADGVLYVDVTDSETAMHLSLQRQRFLAVYHDTYGLHEVKDVRFQAGRVTGDADDGEEEPGGAPSPDPAEVASLESAVAAASLPDDVAAVARGAARALAAHWARQRAAGHTACPTCGALHDGVLTGLAPRDRRLAELGRDSEGLRDRELCPSCRRAAREPRVVAAARRLALDPSEPHPELAPEEAAVARRLATLYLEDTVTDLLPRVVSDPALRPHLERAARCLAALRTGKGEGDLTDDDLRLLDERVARVLGWGRT